MRSDNWRLLLRAGALCCTLIVTGLLGSHVPSFASGLRPAQSAAANAAQPAQAETIHVDLSASAHPFPHFWEQMFGSGRAILTLRDSYRQDLREVLALAAKGKIHCRVATRPLSEANAVMDQLRRGQVSGRIALSFPS